MYPTTRQMKRKKVISNLISVATFLTIIAAGILGFQQNLWSIPLVLLAAGAHVANRIYRYGTLYP